MTRPRLDWMDATRGAAILLVLIQHSVTVPIWDGLESSQTLSIINDFFSPYRMPLLLVLSGLMLPRSMEKPLPTYVTGKVRRIVWPLILWTLIVWSLNPPSFSNPSSIIGPRHLWFLVVLVGCYAVGPFTRWVHPFVFAAAMLAFAVLVPGSVFPLAPLLGYGAYFMLGAGLNASLDKLQRFSGWTMAAVGVAAIAWGCAQWFIIEDAPLWLSFPMSLAGIAAALWVAPRISSPSWMRWVGRNSMAFYVAHAPVMIGICALVASIGSLQGDLLSLILLSTAGVVCFVLARARWAQWMFVWSARRASVGRRNVPALPRR